MTDPETIHLQPWCEKCAGQPSDTGRLWCDHDAWGPCDCGAMPVKYIKAHDQPEKPEVEADDE